MTKIDYFQWFSLLLCIAIILAMVFTRSINVTGLAVLLVGIYFFSNKFGVNSIFVKIAMGMIVFVIVISVISFFFSAEIKLPEFGKNLLLSNADLTSNPAKPIDVKKIVTPDSPKYTYAFSFYLKTAKTAAVKVNEMEKTYIFYRKDDAAPSSMTYAYKDDKTPNTHGKNIGLRFGNTNDFRTLYLDYAVKPDESSTAFYTTLVYSNFPIMQWMDIVISVDKNIINVYIDGKKITKQIYASNLKAPSISKSIDFGIMDARLANFYHLPDTIKPTQSLIEYLSKVDGISVA